MEPNTTMEPNTIMELSQIMELSLIMEPNSTMELILIMEPNSAMEPNLTMEGKIPLSQLKTQLQLFLTRILQQEPQLLVIIVTLPMSKIIPHNL